MVSTAQIAAGTWLIFGAVLKIVQLTSDFATEDTEYFSRPTLIRLSVFEICLAWALLTNSFPRLSRLAAISLFAGFIAFLSWKLRNGDNECGCMGAVQIHPLIMLVIDCAIAIGLLIWQPKPRNGWSLRQNLTTVFCLTVLSLSMLAIWRIKIKSLDEVHLIIGGPNEMVVLEPSNWLQKQFPLFKFMEDCDDLKSGEWRLVFVKSNCNKCKETMFKELQSDSAKKLAFVQIDRPGKLSIRLDDSVRLLQLSTETTWFVESPTTIHLKNGTVVLVY